MTAICMLNALGFTCTEGNMPGRMQHDCTILTTYTFSTTTDERPLPCSLWPG